MFTIRIYGQRKISLFDYHTVQESVRRLTNSRTRHLHFDRRLCARRDWFDFSRISEESSFVTLTARVNLKLTGRICIVEYKRDELVGLRPRQTEKNRTEWKKKEKNERMLVRIRFCRSFSFLLSSFFSLSLFSIFS
jgi:hypothetical protein